MNNSNADVIDMFFNNKQLQRVVFRSEVTGTTYPMSQIPEDKRLLRNFKWLENKRPKSKFELFENLPEEEN
jgi:hypothetical protein